MKFNKINTVVLVFLIMAVLIFFSTTKIKNTPVITNFNVKNVMNIDNEYNMLEFLENTHDTEVPIEDYTTVLFPRTDVTMGMTVEELLEKYKDKGIPHPGWYDLYVKYNITIFQERIRENMFWNATEIHINDGRVTLLRYGAYDMGQGLHGLDIHNSDDALRKTEELFELLKLHLGNEYEKILVYNSRAIMFLWKRDGDWVAFIPSNKQSGQANMYFPYLLYIVLTKEKLEQWFPIISSEVPEAASLWLEDAP